MLLFLKMLAKKPFGFVHKVWTFCPKTLTTSAFANYLMHKCTNSRSDFKIIYDQSLTSWVGYINYDHWISSVSYCVTPHYNKDKIDHFIIIALTTLTSDFDSELLSISQVHVLNFCFCCHLLQPNSFLWFILKTEYRSFIRHAFFIYLHLIKWIQLYQKRWTF